MSDNKAKATTKTVTPPASPVRQSTPPPATIQIPPSASTNGATPPAATATAPAPPKKIALEKRLAIMLSRVVKVAKEKGITDPIIEEAATLSQGIADELLKPLDTRIAEIVKEIKALDFTQNGTGEEMTTLSKELTKLQAKKELLNG